MKKCLIVTSVASMLEQYNVPNIKLLQSMGYEVSVAANFTFGNTASKERMEEFSAELKNMMVQKHEILFFRNAFKPKNIGAYKELKRLIEREKFDLIHCQSPIGGVLTRLAARKMKNVRIIYTAHGFHFFKGSSKMNWLCFYPIEKLLSRYTDSLVTMNSEDYSRAKKWKLRGNGRVHYIHGVGIDLEKFVPPGEGEKEFLRREMGFAQEDFVLIYIAELSKRKHQDVLLRAMKLLQGNRVVKLLLVGQGELLESYKDMARELQIEDRVIFTGYRRDIAELLKLSDICVSSSRQEGLPVNIMESMATGLPVIASACRGNVDLVDEENGILIDKDCAEDYATAVQWLVDAATLREAFGGEGQKKVLAYSAEQVLQEMKHIYEQ